MVLLRGNDDATNRMTMLRLYWQSFVVIMPSSLLVILPVVNFLYVWWIASVPFAGALGSSQ